MQIKNVAQLKRIPVGTKLRVIRCLLGEVAESKQARTVAKVNSNTIEMVVEGKDSHSFLNIPKASNFRSDPNGFTVFEDCEHRPSYEPAETPEGKTVAAQYVFV